MARTRYYKFQFSNGLIKFMTPEEASLFSDENNLDITSNGFTNRSNTLIRRIRDGFQSGFNPALGQYVGTKREHTRLLKERGLVEMGKEQHVKRDYDKNYVSDATIQDAVSRGAELSGNEIAALKNGTKLHK